MQPNPYHPSTGRFVFRANGQIVGHAEADIKDCPVAKSLNMGKSVEEALKRMESSDEEDHDS